MSLSISMAYIQGVQEKLAEAGFVRYASEQQAAQDAQQLGQGIEQSMPVNQGGLASEGASPQETQVIATALSDMASQASEEAKGAAAKAAIVEDAIQKIAYCQKDEWSKFAAEARSPGNDNVVAGHKPGHVAAGESDASSNDHDKELSNAVPNTHKRKDYFSSMPGQQADDDKGHIGTERPHEGRDAQGGVTANLDKELSNAVPNTAERKDYYGKPGHQVDDDKGHVGIQQKTAHISDVLSRI